MAYKYASDEWNESEPVNITVGAVAIGNATVYNAVGKSWMGLASVSGKVGLNTGANWVGLSSVAFLGIDTANSVVKTEQQFSPWYTSGPTVDAIVKGSAGFLHSVIVGAAVGSSIIEISDHASDGDGAVKLYLAGDALGPAVYPVNAKFATGITTDITLQTQVTLVYR